MVPAAGRDTGVQFIPLVLCSMVAAPPARKKLLLKVQTAVRSWVVGAGNEYQTTPIVLAELVEKVPSALVSTTVLKAFGLTARLPLVPAASSRFVLPPTQRKTVLVEEIEFVSGRASTLQSPPSSLS